jgi:UDP-N-acetylmuramate dehydrogenase
VRSLRETAAKIKTTLPLLLDEPMAEHTTLRIGGPADLYARPVNAREVIELCGHCVREGIPCFPLGAGANILVSDRGIRGMVIDTAGLRGIERAGHVLHVLAGTPMSHVSGYAADGSLTGLEFIYAMPGSVGGSIWMNARCYGGSVSDVLTRVSYMDLKGDPLERSLDVTPRLFSYKTSPFQRMSCLITGAWFGLRDGDRMHSRALMEEHREDRTAKGHFLFPSAGSAFKNNPSFGKPSGKIIDELGLRGYREGGAAIAQYHGNIVINTGGATARDLLSVLKRAERAAAEARGIRLEREVVLVGDWDGMDTTA